MVKLPGNCYVDPRYVTSVFEARKVGEDAAGEQYYTDEVYAAVSLVCGRTHTFDVSVDELLTVLFPPPEPIVLESLGG